MGIMRSKIKCGKYITSYTTQSGSLTIMVYKLHIDKSTQNKYGMIFGRYPPNNLGIDIEIYEHTIAGDVVPYEECTAPMVDLNNC